MTNSGNDRLPLDEWQVETIRLTSFLTTQRSSDRLSTSWWKDYVGDSPEASINQAKQQTVQDIGPFADGQLALIVKSNLVEWRYSSLITTGTYPTLGKLPDVLSIFLDLIIRWLQSEECPSIKRLGLGIVLYYPVSSRADGYRLLFQYTPTVSSDPEGISDFAYQINRPRTFQAVERLKANRLTKWSVAKVQIEENSVGSEDRHIWEKMFCSIDLDINTDQERPEEFQTETLLQLLDELVMLGKEIIENGDIP